MVAVSRRIRAPAQPVWTLLVETRYWTGWGATIVDVDAPDRLAPGTTGRVRPVVGPWLPFEVTAFDEATMYWAWTVAGVPATTHRVSASDSRSCTATIGVPVWAPPYAIPVWFSLRRLDQLASTAR